MGINASDAGSHLYFWQKLLFSGLNLILGGEAHYRQTFEGRVLHPLAVLLFSHIFIALFYKKIPVTINVLYMF